MFFDFYNDRFESCLLNWYLDFYLFRFSVWNWKYKNKEYVVFNFFYGNYIMIEKIDIK